MPPHSDVAELSTLRSQIEEIARRIETVADRYADTPDSQIASDLYTAESQLTAARRALDKAIAGLQALSA